MINNSRGDEFAFHKVKLFGSHSFIADVAFILLLTVCFLTSYESDVTLSYLNIYLYTGCLHSQCIWSLLSNSAKPVFLLDGVYSGGRGRMCLRTTNTTLWFRIDFIKPQSSKATSKKKADELFMENEPIIEEKMMDEEELQEKLIGCWGYRGLLQLRFSTFG